MREERKELHEKKNDSLGLRIILKIMKVSEGIKEKKLSFGWPRDLNTFSTLEIQISQILKLDSIFLCGSYALLIPLNFNKYKYNPYALLSQF